MPKLAHCHTIGASDSLASRALGALAFICVWGVGQFIGPLSLPLLAVTAYYQVLPWYILLALAALMAYPFCVAPESLYSPRWCRFVLSQAGWIKGGARLWCSNDVLSLGDRVNEGIMVAYHPHGFP